MNELNLSWIRSLGYNADQLNKNIFVVKNFLKSEEIEGLLKYLKSIPEEQWKDHYMGGVERLAYLKYNRTDLDNMIKEGLVEITTNWNDKNLATPIKYSIAIDDRARKLFAFDNNINYNGSGTIQRMPKGTSLTAHVDDHSDPSIVWAAVIYLNDDFDGGDIFFQDLDIQIKPSPGSLLVFPGTKNYKHGVTAVESDNVRYVIPSFVGRKGFYSN